ncbi:MFS transporter [Chitinasiproducens palmae]|uniref:Sugar phosphate permease n=1 Tax=Chitinasiproducens palmae TaxID=1770053 RepID=A0A1H2PME6_9BURK|nr:MFS transporter [Chitinasiproducens palmae]SDV46902.1 Sugar phosphate permease [Chitinasiproducens palmae]
MPERDDPRQSRLEPQQSDADADASAQLDGASAAAGAPVGPLASASFTGTRRTDTLTPSASASPLARAALAGLIVSFALMVAGNGLFQTIVPLWVLDTGHSTLLIGLIQSCYYAGFIAGALVNRVLIHRIGQHRTFVAYAAAAAILALAFGQSHSPTAFALVRAISGFVFMGLYGSCESWLNSYAGNEKRGQLFGIYSTINYLSLGSGQFLIKLQNGFSVQQFTVAAALFASAVIPATLLSGGEKREAAPPPSMPAVNWKTSLGEMLRDSPLAIPGGILTGFLYSSFYSLAPVYLVGNGFSTADLSVFMGVALIVALLPQWPMGRLSDRIDRRRLLSGVALLSAAMSAALLVSSTRSVIWCAMLAYVAVTFTLYGVVISHVQDCTQARYRLSMSITLLVLFSFGGMTGPALASLAMTLIGPSGFFVFNLCSCVLLAWAARAVGRPPSRNA